MINRHILRIKAMQALYACKQAEGANFEVALDQIDQTFSHDLNASESPDLKKLEGSRKLARLIFEENYLNGSVPTDEEASEEIRLAVTKAIIYYQNQVKNDIRQYEKQMVTEAEKIYELYLLILLLLVELSDYVQDEQEEQQQKMIKPRPASSRELKLHTNKVIASLRENGPLQTEAIRRGLGWGNKRDFYKSLYKDALKSDSVYQEYVQLTEATFEDDKKIVNHIVKQIIFKHALSITYFEEVDLKWAEDSEIIKSMVSKTIKSIEEGNPQFVELQPLAKNWEDDRDFFKDIYKYTIENDREYEILISGKTQHWDVERVALLDKIILKMAIAEMLHFPSIPVKVTINEYIEISKHYSTPKSKQFVNGLLDAIVNELRANGRLKKSGRGLIDNK